MIVSRDREKMIHAIIYFVGGTKHAHTLKIFKLLNFLDFEHFRQAGRTVTGLTYAALPKGPVPTALLREMQRGGETDLKAAIALFEARDEVTDAILRRDLRPKVPFNANLFSKREMTIMERLAEFFFEFRGDDMSEFSHMRKLPWRNVFNNGKGANLPIPPELSFESDPIVHDVPTIDRDEFEYRKELLKGVG